MDEIQQHQAVTQSTMQAGFQDLMTTLQLTYLNDDQVQIEGDNLSAGVEALRYLSKHLSHSLASLSKSSDGFILPRDVAATLTGEVDKMIRYSRYCNRAGRNTAFPGLDFALSQGTCIHTIPLRVHSRINDNNGYITIEVTGGEDPLGRRTQHIRFASFTIGPSGYGSAVLGLVSQVYLRDTQQIHRQMRVLNILPLDSPVFDLADIDDVEGIKKLLMAGEASILDYSEYGTSLLWARYQPLP